MTAAEETDEAGIFTRAFKEVTGRTFVPRNLRFAAWMAEAAADGELQQAADRGGYTSETEQRQASDEYEDRAERAAAMARDERAL